MAETFTLYKLIVLYMLDRVDFPLTTSQISEFILDKGYTTYFRLQSALAELTDSGLLKIELTHNRTLYNLTEEGAATINYFRNKISPEIRQEIDNFINEKKYDEAISETEKALLRYPNDFRIVYRSGELYTVAGIERCEERYIRRSIELLERAVLLLPQNTDPDISEVSIRNEIAQSYIVLGQHEKGLEILKKYNVSGVHNALIAITYTGNHGLDPKDAESYMMGAFGSIITSAVRTMMAYANYYFKVEDYASSREALIWLAEMLEGIKLDKNSVAYVDKVTAPCYSECANLSFLLGEEEKVEPYLRRAYKIAKAFDAAPTYKMENIKFCVGDVEKATAYDDLGDSAITAAENQITQENRDEILYKIWRRIVAEESTGGAE